jgi:hypothetical protein
MRRWLQRRLVVVLAAQLAAAAAMLGAAQPAGAAPAGQQAGPAGCRLANGIQHVVYVQFDNTHLFRDRPQFASDLQQMPNLLGFLRDNGTVDNNDHTILISHTAGGILSSLTGLYPDRNGTTVSNSYRYFKPDGTSASVPAFKYWTDLVDSEGAPSLDPLPNMVNADGGTPRTTPAPWVPYTRAGCDFGAVASANTVLENTSTGPNGDMTKVFGQGSPEWNAAAASNAAAPGTAARTLAQTDFVGLTVHCGRGGGVCAGSAGARVDALPDEVGGYTGFHGLFGAKAVNPAIANGRPVVNSTAGRPITDQFGQPGFPGFDGMSAAVSLGYVAQMQEAGVPVTYAYVSDAHDDHQAGAAFGPGEAGYVRQLQQYDQAFGTFFDRLKHDRIDKSNTLFVFTVDESDHFAGGSSASGTWSHTFCNVSAGQTCPANQIGEVTANLNALLPADPARPAFALHSDSAPTVYVNGQPVRTDAAVRKLERDVAAAKAVDPYLSASPAPITLFLADPVEERTLHMVNADPRRTPTFTLFGNPDYFITTSSARCPDAASVAPVCVDFHFAWSHGDATADIGRTWLGLVGPGVRHLGETSRIWSDHTDVRPTMLALTGLRDTYAQDGRVLTQALETRALPPGLRDDRETMVRLGDVYKQVTAPFGRFAHDTLAASTAALGSGSATDDSRYASTENRILSLTQRRDAVAAQMRAALNDAAFGGSRAGDDRLERLIDQGDALLEQAASLGGADA